MKMTRRQMILGSAATVSLWTAGGLPGLSLARAADVKTLKISHQFPSQGDFRNDLCKRFGAEVEKRTNGALKFQVYPGSSLMKTEAQFNAVEMGALDLTLYPLPYAAGHVRELGIGLMPGLVTSYANATAWRNADIGKALVQLLDAKGIVMLSWVWQAGGVASRPRAIVEPADAKDLKIRGGSRAMDRMLEAAGASVISLPSNELYADMQTGVMDAALTSSTSLMSFKLDEVSKFLTAPSHEAAYWFMLNGLLMSKDSFNQLSKAQQDVIRQVGAEMDPYDVQGAEADDRSVAAVYGKAGAKVVSLDKATVQKWREIARNSAWKDYAAQTKDCARFLKLAQQVQA